jgi:2,4-dienoyl-CoA reductase (NADPH2)
VRIWVAGEERVVPADTGGDLCRAGPAARSHDELRARGVKALVIGGAERAAELGAMRAIDQGTRLAFSL